ncbi:superoxide dismutase family protein [Croceitalea rosinachiae]|uniref:Superoxide dismutase family protein n=1 Tax=Croceitalea rosinachiae TaxID=3075596 RepID=A0ABU3AB37_9FLAO|nr:superoxide dismutase family protein [Croceitalea sp. F388]MDT0607125.1 superoxide dismutase family protein [Croceitalea sp. F388]
MKKIQATLIGILLVTAFSCKEVKKDTDAAKEEIEEVETEVEMAKNEAITFKLEPKSDSSVSGEVTFSEEGGTVSMSASLTGLTEGEHAIHIHEKADCSSADGKSTGGHWNPTFQPHAKWGAEGGYHRGDIGNFNADENGNASISFATNEWCIGCDDETKNIIGKAIIVHQGVDDFTSQPSGAAGARVACTGIIQ